RVQVSGRQQLADRLVGGIAHAEVIRVEDDRARVGLETESAGEVGRRGHQGVLSFLERMLLKARSRSSIVASLMAPIIVASRPNAEVTNRSDRACGRSSAARRTAASKYGCAACAARMKAAGSMTRVTLPARIVSRRASSSTSS